MTPAKPQSRALYVYIEPTEGLELCQGMTGNPNMLGSIMNRAVPCLPWQAYRYRASRTPFHRCYGKIATLIVAGVEER